MKVLTNVSLALLSLILLFLVKQYFFCPQMKFESSTPFSGHNWYNPYANVQPKNWVKCNFHAHTNSWRSVSNGRGTAEDLKEAYTRLGYGIYSASEYQKVNEALSREPNYIYAYEHGYNIRKTHQLVIGDDQVTWLDYVFPQTLANKQNVLDHLSASGKAVVVLNHPNIRDGYTAEDMKYLGNFHCIEVLNPSAISFEVWDAALTAGKPVFITGNDDVHDIFNPSQSGRFCTWLNIPACTQTKVVEALRSGKGYGMRVASIPGETPEHRVQRIRYNLPSLQNFELKNDSVRITMSNIAASIEFIGQGGRVLHTVNNTSDASYAIAPRDEYVRTAVYFADGTGIFLNPVFRYSNDPFVANGGHSINTTRSHLYFLAGLIILFSWLAMVLRITVADSKLFRMLRIPRPSRDKGLSGNPA